MSSTESQQNGLDSNSSEKLQFVSNNNFNDEVSVENITKLQSKPCIGVSGDHNVSKFNNKISSLYIEKLHSKPENEISRQDVNKSSSKSANDASLHNVIKLHNQFNNEIPGQDINKLHNGFNNEIIGQDVNKLLKESNNEIPVKDVNQLLNKVNNDIPAQDVNKLHINGVSLQNGELYSKSVLVRDQLTAEDLRKLFEDEICVLHIPNFIPPEVTGQLNRFLHEKGSEQYTHEVRNEDGSTELQYFGVNRYGRPLNSTYNDPTGESLKQYFADALPTMQSIRRAAHPYLSPIDKLRVELDELWNGKVNVATLNGRKTFCGIGRIMPASLSALSAVQPHFDAVPTSYFPNIFKQFAANIYLNVPPLGGELEIWDVPPVDVSNEDFTIPEDWRSVLPASILVKPGPGDLLLLNTRRPHAITEFTCMEPRTSVQTFIGLTKDSDVFLWV